MITLHPQCVRKQFAFQVSTWGQFLPSIVFGDGSENTTNSKDSNSNNNNSPDASSLLPKFKASDVDDISLYLEELDVKPLDKYVLMTDHTACKVDVGKGFIMKMSTDTILNFLTMCTPQNGKTPFHQGLTTSWSSALGQEVSSQECLFS